MLKVLVRSCSTLATLGGVWPTRILCPWASPTRMLEAAWTVPDNFRVKDLQAERDQWKPKLRPLKRNKAGGGGGHRVFRQKTPRVTLEIPSLTTIGIRRRTAMGAHRMYSMKSKPKVGSGQ